METITGVSGTAIGLTPLQRRRLWGINIAVGTVGLGAVELLSAFSLIDKWIPSQSREPWTLTWIVTVVGIALTSSYIYVVRIISARVRTIEQSLKRTISLQSRSGASEAILTALESCQDGAEIDALGTGLNDFWDTAHQRLKELPERCRVRVLLLDPSFPDPREGRNIASLQERALGSPERQIRRDVLRWHSWMTNDQTLASRIDIRLYRTVPAFEIIRVDGSIMFTPSPLHSHSRDIPAFYIRDLGDSKEDAQDFVRALNDQFSSVWNSPSTRPLDRVPAWEFDAWRAEILVPLSN